MSVQKIRHQGGSLEEPSNYKHLDIEDAINSPRAQDVVLSTNILEDSTSSSDSSDEWLKAQVDMDVMSPEDTLAPVDIFCVPDFPLNLIKTTIDVDPFIHNLDDPLNLSSKDSLSGKSSWDNDVEFPEEFNLLTQMTTESPSLTISGPSRILTSPSNEPEPVQIVESRAPAAKAGPSKAKPKAVKPPPNPRSILKRTVAKQTSLPSKPDKINSSKAIIAISTDKSKNMTEIVINTSKGEQIFKGCTSDLMKASNTKGTEKLEKMLTRTGKSNILKPAEIHKLSKSLPISPNPEQLIKPLVGNDLLNCLTEVEEKPTVEALSHLGIQLDKVPFIINELGNKLWMCPIFGCSNVLSKQTLLKVHILKHFGLKPYKCPSIGCDWAFYTYYKLKRHKETHLKKKDFVCTVAECGKRFTTIYNLHSHEKLHSRPAELSCPVPDCPDRFQTKRRLELHLKVHDSSVAPYRCTFEGCGKHYYSANSLNSHSRSHLHSDAELRCSWPDCNKLFTKPCRLRAHMRVHTGEKPYPCRFPGCSWAFASASKLRRHQHKHTNERKFRCSEPTCRKAFMRSEHLREHSLTHQSPAQRNYFCPIPGCGVGFSAKSSLYVHIKRHKADEEKIEDKEKQIPDIDHEPIDDPSCTAARTRCSNNIKVTEIQLSEDEEEDDNTEEEEMVTLPNLLLHEDLQLMPILDSSGSQVTTINLQDLQ